ncbi:MAG: hypothetical protein ABL998_23780, partial [Planctomycetota bacterium]
LQAPGEFTGLRELAEGRLDFAADERELCTQPLEARERVPGLGARRLGDYERFAQFDHVRGDRGGCHQEGASDQSDETPWSSLVLGSASRAAEGSSRPGAGAGVKARKETEHSPH